jgi:hypothetical protein
MRSIAAQQKFNAACALRVIKEHFETAGVRPSLGPTKLPHDAGRRRLQWDLLVWLLDRVGHGGGEVLVR